MTDQELDEMMVAADSDHDGFINYEGQYYNSRNNSRTDRIPEK